jgi:hypothetical protein
MSTTPLSPAPSTLPNPPPPGRADYGIDAPGVIRAFILLGVIGLAPLGTRVAGLWNEWMSSRRGRTTTVGPAVPAGGTADRADHKTRTGGACPARADSDGDTGQGKPRPYGMTCIVPGRHSRPYGMRPLRQRSGTRMPPLLDGAPPALLLTSARK